MRRTATQPTGIERTFADHEIIVTKTDMKGLLTYANDVFLRLSVFDEEDVIGKPHNIIRHPDMPRIVFKLLWDTLREGREIFAYVVNMASDGAEYWVLAHVTPSRDASGRIVGYHSSRRRPDRSAVNAVKELYGRLRAEEKRHRSPSDGLDASGRMLQAELAARGRTYEEFVFDLTLGAAGTTPAAPSPNALSPSAAPRDGRLNAGPAPGRAGKVTVTTNAARNKKPIKVVRNVTSGRNA